MCWGGGYTSFSTGNKKMCFSSKQIKISFDWGRPPENLGYRHEKKNKTDYSTDDVPADPSTMGGNRSETKQDMMNRVVYRVIRTYSMPSFCMDGQRFVLQFGYAVQMYL